MTRISTLTLLVSVICLGGWLAVASAQTSYSIIVTSVSPNTIDPRKNESARVTYRVPTTLRPASITVTDATGALVRTIASYRSLSSGTYTTTWNGRNSTNSNVPDGIYTLTISGESKRGAVQSGTAAITVKSGPIVYTLKITGVSQTALDPANGERTTLTYTVPTALTALNITVLDEAGIDMRTLATLTTVTAGTKTIVWDGLDDNKQVVPDGTYTLSIDGEAAGAEVTVLPATQVLTVKSGPLPPTLEGEKGNVIEGLFAASYPNLRYPEIRFGVSFVAPRTGTLSEITMQWKSSRGYGAGNGGRYTFEIQTNDPLTNFPSGTVIVTVERVAARDAMDKIADGAFHFPITATLTAGEIYHLVVTNVDSRPLNNWASPNTMATRVKPWDASGIGGIANGRAISYYMGGWTCWTAPENPWSGGDYTVNGCHVSMMLSWTDEPIKLGDPYYCALVNEQFAAHIYGTRKFGELIAWTGDKAEITSIGFPLYKVGEPTGDLLFHLEEVGGTGELAGGMVVSPTDTRTMQGWHYVTLEQPVTLEKDKTYRLWLEAPTGTDSTNYYFQRVPYGESRPAAWLECGWGGTASYYIYNLGSSWSSWKNADFSFSLQ